MAFDISATAKPDQDEMAMRSIYTEAQRIYKHGYTNGQLDRAKTNYLSAIENQYKQRGKISNDRYAKDFKSHFIDGEPLTSIEFDWDFVQKIMPTITIEEISQLVKKWISPENRTVVVVGPDQPGAKHLSKENAFKIISEVENSEIEPYKEEEISSNLIEEPLAGSKIQKTRLIPELNAVEWTLGNQAKMVFKKADYEKDKVSLIALSNGGSSKLKTDQLGSAMLRGDFIGAFGAGEYDATSLKKSLTGKQVSMKIDPSELEEVFSGTSTPKDFESILIKLRPEEVQKMAKAFVSKADVVDVIFKPKAE